MKFTARTSYDYVMSSRGVHGILLTKVLAFSALFKFLCTPLPALYLFSS